MAFVDRTDTNYWEDEPGDFSTYWTWTGTEWHMLNAFSPGGGNLQVVDDTGGYGPAWYENFRPSSIRITYSSNSTSGGLYEAPLIEVKNQFSNVIASMVPVVNSTASLQVESPLDFLGGGDVDMQRIDVSQIYDDFSGTLFIIEKIEFFDAPIASDFWTGFVDSEEII